MNIREQLQKFSRWAGIVGWITVVSGGLSALGGLFLFIIGTIPGIITIILVIKLISAKKHANTLVMNEAADNAEMLMLITELTNYFKIQGILIIVGLALAILAISFGVFGAIMSELYYLY